jgi:hypothetical protein
LTASHRQIKKSSVGMTVTPTLRPRRLCGEISILDKNQMDSHTISQKVLNIIRIQGVEESRIQVTRHDEQSE